MKGTITTVKQDKGIGFLRDESGRDRFFHHTEVVTPFAGLQAGIVVEFDAYEVPPSAKNNGLRARGITVSAAPSADTQ